MNALPSSPTAPADLTRRRLWLALGWFGVGLIILLSLIPNPPQAEIRNIDKAEHLLAYGGLMFWFAQLHARRLPWALLFFGLGAGLEVAQGMTGYRDMSLADLVADGLGIGLGWLAARAFPRVLAGLEARLP